MQKIGLAMILVGALIAIGLFLSQYSSQIIVEDLVTNELDVLPGDLLEVVTELDPKINKEGVYFVQTQNFKDGTISAKIFDPSENQIVSKNVVVEKFEEIFTIEMVGEYRLEVENRGSEEIHVVGVLGHMPDSTKVAIRNASFAFLIVGMVGMVGVGLFAIKERVRKKSN